MATAVDETSGTDVATVEEDTQLALPTRRDALALLFTLENLEVLEPTSLNLTEDIEFSKWASIGHLLGSLRDSNKFWVGDWLIFGENSYGETYSQALEATGLSYATLTNYRYVCSAVVRSRRRELLTFSHHAEVAAMSAREQTTWLKRAEKNEWSVKQMREAISEERQLPPADPPPVTDDGDDGIVVENIESVAKAVWSQSKRVEDHYEVPVEPMYRLASLLGYEA